MSQFSALLLVRNPILHGDFSVVNLGKEALDNMEMPMNNNEEGLHPFIDTHRDNSGSSIAKKGDIYYYKKHTVKAERGRHEWGGIFPRFACAGINISAFFADSYICAYL